jgi:hypothetical protein
MAYSSGKAQTCQNYDIYGESLFRGYGFGVTNHHFNILIDQNSTPCDNEPDWYDLTTGACFSEIYEGGVGEVKNGAYNVLWVNPTTDDDTEDYANGVTTADRYKIYKHYENIETITDPYKIIAADPSGDHIIDVDDYYELTNLFLYETPFTRNSWEWFNKEEISDNWSSFSANPWNYGIKEQWPGGRIYSNIPSSDFEDEADFHQYFDYRCTKIGDIDAVSSNSWVCGTYSIQNQKLLTRSFIDGNDYIPAASIITISCIFKNDVDIVDMQLPIYINHKNFRILNVSLNKNIPIQYNYLENSDRLIALMDNLEMNKIHISGGESVLKLELLALKESVFTKDIKWDYKRNVEAINFDGDLVETNASLDLVSLKVKNLHAIYLQSNHELLVTSNDEISGVIEVYSIAGNLIRRFPVSLVKGNQTISIDDILPVGIHIIKLKTPLEETSLKIIK